MKDYNFGSKMKPYSIDFREKIVSAMEKGDSSIRKVAARFAVSKSCVERWMIQKRTEGHVVPHKQGGSVSPVMEHKDQLVAIFENQRDATLAEYCELLFDETGLWVSQSTMCRTFQRLNLPRKKKRSAPAKPPANESNS
ncbi:transposase [Phormidium sp. CLA17]|uniref:helix-turn-helix domain-containing protein n=3 Tax=Leptolyngbya sp. Cla-17 TaxID=2803751 RepID=UPI001491E1F3|nr:helix-turn-helix domain-containing protein [Leptolyngbya sp. Cla-17]MBM0740967.1 transposase [Leptolyngbya sp. Cla-17]